MTRTVIVSGSMPCEHDGALGSRANGAGRQARSTPAYRYEQTARFITDLVDGGTLIPGARVPSLRQITKQRGVSLSTALQAYRALEDRGILQAKPQSGFYVAKGAPILLETPTISRPPGRATTVAVSGVVPKLLEYAADPDLVPLGCAIPDAELLAAGRLDRFLARAARVKGVDYNTYTVPKGDPRLRREIARRALRWGQALSPEDIAITCGCTEALVLALKVVSRPGDTIAIESPTYFGFLQVLEALDLKALELPTDANSGVDLTALRRALEATSVKACLLSSSFNNPLGCTMSDARKRAVLALLAQHRIPLIEDDIYGDIYFGDERPKPFMALDPHGNTIYCSSFSKTIAPGYRIGWIVTGRHMPEVLESKLAFTLCGPALPQAALAEFLASGGYDSHLRRVRRTFRDNIDRMIRTIDRAFPGGTRVSRPDGGFVLWLQLPKPLASRELFEAALKKGVCFVPGDVFSATHRYANCLRVSCGSAWHPRIEKGLETLGELASALLARQQRSGSPPRRGHRADYLSARHEGDSGGIAAPEGGRSRRRR
jgi:DNA-binding transcriptional MocR family regulator